MYILLRTPAKSNWHRFKSGLIPLIPIPIPTQSVPLLTLRLPDSSQRIYRFHLGLGACLSSQSSQR